MKIIKSVAFAVFVYVFGTFLNIFRYYLFSRNYNSVQADFIDGGLTIANFIMHLVLVIAFYKISSKNKVSTKFLILLSLGVYFLTNLTHIVAYDSLTWLHTLYSFDPELVLMIIYIALNSLVYFLGLHLIGLNKKHK